MATAAARAASRFHLVLPLEKFWARFLITNETASFSDAASLSTWGKIF